MPRCFLRACGALSLLLLSGCALTSGLADWGRQLDDPVSAVLTSTDHRQIVLIGKYRHYVLDEVAPGLQDVLALEQGQAFKVKRAELRMDTKGKVDGKLFVVADPALLAEAEQATLRAAGYRPASDAPVLFRAFAISGQAYRPGKAPVLPPAAFSPAFTLSLRKPAEHWQNAVKLPLSPVTLTADAGIVAAGVALAVPTILLVCLYGDVTGTSGGFCSAGR